MLSAQSSSAGDRLETEVSERPPVLPCDGATLAALYDAHCDFVFRTLRRLGVPDASADDALQDVFLVVHRRYGEFEGRSSLRTWLFGIARRVAAGYRRARRDAHEHDPLDESLADGGAASALDLTARAEAARLLQQLLAALDETKREVFVMIDLEQMTLDEAAEALQINRNTAYSRLRAARTEVEQALARLRARQAPRQR